MHDCTTLLLYQNPGGQENDIRYYERGYIRLPMFQCTNANHPRAIQKYKKPLFIEIKHMHNKQMQKIKPYTTKTVTDHYKGT